jgi:putative endonuclease
MRTDGCYLYILQCHDGSFYVGTTRAALERRIAEHNAGNLGGFPAKRRPVTLVFHEFFERIEDATAAERRVKGWRRDKKEALLRGDYQALPVLSARGMKAAASPAHPSRRGPAARSSG